MDMRAIRKDDLGSFVSGLLRDYEVAGPVARPGGKYAFDAVTSPGEMRLDYDTTLLPPKKYLLPQRETLFTYTLGDSPELSPAIETPRRVVFGVHSCDLHGIWLLEDIFAEGSRDAHFHARREGTRFIGMDCKAPCFENSFCKDMGTLEPGGGYDLFLTDLGDTYAVQVGAKNGAELLGYGRFFAPDHGLMERFFDAWRRKVEAFPERLGYDAGRLPGILAESYDDIIWDSLEERCFDCGACTVVCPTCYCFDVLDETDAALASGTRYRRWDSCQLRDFALLASGENMRGKRSDRLRHRLFRKGKYFKERFGRFACVGCGRCGRACLVNIDVQAVFRQLRS